MNLVRVVVDSSVVIKWFTTEPFTEQARRILDDYRDGALSLLAPDLLFAEVGNIIWKKQRLQGLTNADAEAIINGVLLLRLQVTPCASLLTAAHQIAVAHGRTVYDAIYLALSLREQCPFVTADERLVNTVGSAFPMVTWLANWH